mmetsp:Transcript_43168/g.77610  ORF Transcript_43168/g.77610 Transcript_43168/m.77610 type:complete len:87 (-) Transcript_43168:182-442(-)
MLMAFGAQNPLAFLHPIHVQVSRWGQDPTSTPKGHILERCLEETRPPYLPTSFLVEAKAPPAPQRGTSGKSRFPAQGGLTQKNVGH